MSEMLASDPLLELDEDGKEDVAEFCDGPGVKTMTTPGLVPSGSAKVTVVGAVIAPVPVQGAVMVLKMPFTVLSPELVADDTDVVIGVEVLEPLDTVVAELVLETEPEFPVEVAEVVGVYTTTTPGLVPAGCTSVVVTGAVSMLVPVYGALMV